MLQCAFVGFRFFLMIDNIFFTQPWRNKIITPCHCAHIWFRNWVQPTLEDINKAFPTIAQMSEIKYNQHNIYLILIFHYIRFKDLKHNNNKIQQMNP